MLGFGCCLPIASIMEKMSAQRGKRVAEFEALENGLNALHNSGYDFAELGVGLLSDMIEQDFAQVKEIIKRSPIKVLAFNSFMPKRLPLTGPSVSKDAVDEYVHKSMARISEIGGRCIVFGSSGARNVPDGFPVAQAMDQLRWFLDLCERYAAQYDLVIAIEPLNKKESNIINTVAEAVELASSLNLPHIKVLADSYHMYLEHEAFGVLYKAAPWLEHVHISEADRSCPGASKQREMDFQALFSTLKRIGYDKGISMECRFDDFELQNPQALSFVKNIWRA